MALQLLITIAKSKLDFNEIEKYMVQDVYSEFARYSVVGYGGEDDNSIDTNNSTPLNKPKDVFESFITHLVEEQSCEDPDVLLFYSVFQNNLKKTKKALDDGANTRCTDKMIVEKYRKEYVAFVSCIDTKNT